MKSVWIYVNTNKEVGDPERFQMFADEGAANAPGLKPSRAVT